MFQSHFSRFTLLMLVSIYSGVAFCDFYVIPVKTKQNVISVASSGGDFTSLDAALASITNATEDNRYTISIKAGTYVINSSVSMKPYVDIVGSGKSTTVLSGAIDALYGMIKGANNASLSNLTVQNIHSGSYAIAISNDSASPDLFNIIAKASSNGASIAIFNNTSSAPHISNSELIGFSGTSCYAVSNRSSSAPLIKNSVLNAYDCTSTNWTLDSEYSYPAVFDSTITSSGTGASTDNTGVLNWDLSNTLLINVTITVSGSSQKNAGITNGNWASSLTSNSTISATGGTASVGVTGPSRIINSTITGGGASDAYCLGCVDGNSQALNTTCN